MTLLSIFDGGLWIIPLVTFLGAVALLVTGYMSSKSNSTTQHPGGVIEDNTGNVPITQTWQFKFGVALLVATAIIIFMMYGDK